MGISKNYQKIIAVIGEDEGNCTLEDKKIAEKVGRKLAKQKAILICGGKKGIMEAACRGAKSAGGLTIGILSTNNPKDANPFVDIVIPTGMGEARNAIIINTAQGIIAIGGRYGTLTEIALGLGKKIPVIGLNTWSLKKNGKADNSIIIARDPEEAVKKALNKINRK